MADVNWTRVRRIVLDDRWRRVYKPDAQAITKITNTLPRASILGFGYYEHTGYWCLLVEAEEFPDQPFGIIRDVSINKIQDAVSRVV